MEKEEKQTMIEKLKSAGRFGLIALGLAGLSLAPRSVLARDGEERFASPEAAEAALAAAAQSRDTNALHAIFGPESRQLVSPDVVQASNAYSNFARGWAKRWNWRASPTRK